MRDKPPLTSPHPSKIPERGSAKRRRKGFTLSLPMLFMVDAAKLMVLAIRNGRCQLCHKRASSKQAFKHFQAEHKEFWRCILTGGIGSLATSFANIIDRYGVPKLLADGPRAMPSTDPQQTGEPRFTPK